MICVSFLTFKQLKRLKLRKNNWSFESYRFDEVFTETASQKRVYEVVAKPVVEVSAWGATPSISVWFIMKFLYLSDLYMYMGTALIGKQNLFLKLWNGPLPHFTLWVCLAALQLAFSICMRFCPASGPLFIFVFYQYHVV